MTYKAGDRVVRTIDGVWGIGRKATIVRKSGRFPDDWIVHVDNDSIEDMPRSWNVNAFVSEEIWDSPLYKALK